MLDPKTNFAESTLASGITIGATSMTLASGDGALYPATSLGSYNVALWNSTDFGSARLDPDKEIVRVTDLTGDVMTITRAQEGTSAAAHNTGGKTYSVLLGVTAKDFDDMTLQSVYSKSTDGQIITDVTRMAVSFKRGSTAEEDNVIEVLQADDTETFSVTGRGLIKSNFVADGNSQFLCDQRVDGAGFSDVLAQSTIFTLGAMPATALNIVYGISVDTTDSSAGLVFLFSGGTAGSGAASVFSVGAGATVGIAMQFVGTPGDMDSALVNAVDERTDLINEGANTSIFVADNDTVTLGHVAKFDEIRVSLTTPSSGDGISPIFEYSTGVGTWASFVPSDGTLGMQITGVMSFDSTALAGWVVGTGSEFLIRITRTRNTLTTTPVASLIQITALDAVYTWDNEGFLNVKGSRTTTFDTDAYTLSAYDVDGAAYVDFITLTAGNTPTCQISDDATFGDAADLTKALGFSLGGATTAKKMTLLSSHTDDRTLTLPDKTGTFQTEELARIAGSTFSTVQHLQDIFHSAGWTSGGVVTDDADGTITVAAGTGLIRATDSQTAEILYFDWASEAGANVALADNDTSYIYAEYNAGSPQVVATTTLRTDFNTNVLLAVIYRAGTTLHINDTERHTVGDHANSMIRRMKETTPYGHVSGAIISETGTRNIALTAGSFWHGLSEFSTTAFDTAVADTFSYWHGDGASGFTETATQTVINNTQYDDGDGTLGTLSNNRYGVHWVYLSTDDTVDVLFGLGDYTLAQAEDAQPPASVPEHITVNSFLAGKIIIQESTTVFTEILSAFQTTFTGSLAADHGGLTGLADDDHTQYTLADGSRAFTGLILRKVTAGITASTTQTQGNGALTSELNEVSTVANTNDTVTLPTAVAGQKVTIFNNGANTLQIFPASGDNLGTGVDTATTLASGSNITFATYDVTNWEEPKTAAAGGGVGAALQFQNAFNVGSAATTYYSNTSNSATETNMAMVVPFAGTIKNLTCNPYQNTATGGTDTTATIYVNGSSTGITLNIVNGVTTVIQDTSNTVSVSAGDRITLEINFTLTGGSITVASAIELA